MNSWGLYSKRRPTAWLRRIEGFGSTRLGSERALTWGTCPMVPGMHPMLHILICCTCSSDELHACSLHDLCLHATHLSWCMNRWCAIRMKVMPAQGPTCQNSHLCASSCRYVVRKDPKNNAVYVSLNYYSDDKHRDAFTCDQFNWINDPPSQLHGSVDEAAPLQVKVRHGAGLYTCLRFEWADDAASAYVAIDGNDQGLAAGQYAVFYQSGVCLGCGVISQSLSQVDEFV